MAELTVPTQRREQLVDITALVQSAVDDSGIRHGLCQVYVPHTTCAIAVNEGFDPDVQSDFLAHLAELVPRQRSWAHAEGNSDAHIKAMLVGTSAGLMVQEGRLRLGRWQAVFLCEFDGPRRRVVWVETQ